jgi:hypothetical protein
MSMTELPPDAKRLLVQTKSFIRNYLIRDGRVRLSELEDFIEKLDEISLHPDVPQNLRRELEESLYDVVKIELQNVVRPRKSVKGRLLTRKSQQSTVRRHLATTPFEAGKQGRQTKRPK